MRKPPAMSGEIRGWMSLAGGLEKKETFLLFLCMFV